MFERILNTPFLPVLAISYFAKIEVKTRKIRKKNSNYPLDIALKLNANKAIRRHPVRLLNVLCMFQVYPVSIYGICVFIETTHAFLFLCQI